MNRSIPFIFFFLFFCTWNDAANAQSAARKTLFNDNWRFFKGDVQNGQSADLPDNAWRTVQLPHDWAIEGPFSQEWASATGFLPGGIGWYRKTFSLSSVAGEQTAVYFDGVYNNSEVWINDHYLGKRPSGFVSFQYDLTPYLKKSGKNVLAVRVDHSKFADSRWYTGSGIYRNVYMVRTGQVHIGLWGVSAVSSVSNETRASVHVNANIVNSSLKKGTFGIKYTLTDAAGKIAASAVKQITVNAGDSALSASEMTVLSPRLWSVDHPARYTLSVSITGAGKTLDTWSEKIGIRNIRFDADKGFFLNGKNIKLKGVCLHDDAGALGVAVPEEVWYRRLQLLKAAGCNSIRMSHNPHADYFYDLCDELGFLVMDEAFDEWEVGKNKWIAGWNVGTPGKDGSSAWFKEWGERDLADLVRRDRNHPSIIMWSIGNEVDYPNDPYTDPVLNTGRNPQIYGKGYLPDHPAAVRLGEISRQLVAVVKRYDVSRPVTAALAGVVMSNNTTYPANLDIVGYNYQEYRYADDHKAYPARVIYGSENSKALDTWNAVDSNLYVSAQYLWTGIDYMGEAGRWPSRSNGAGIMDLGGFPKPEYYFRQSLWSEQPMVYLVTAPARTGTGGGNGRNRGPLAASWSYNPGDKVQVSCYTNCPEAELFLNGRSLGKKTLAAAAGRVITWETDYAAGELSVKASPATGKSVSFNLKTAGEAAAISARAFQLPAGRKAKVEQVLVQVTDKDGIPVLRTDKELTVTVTGGGSLIGLESGSLNSHEDYRAAKRQTVNGRLIAYVKRGEGRLPLSVKITGDGLTAETIVLK